jgi:hypothetical protein
MLTPTWGLYNTNMHKSREYQIFFEKSHFPAKVNYDKSKYITILAKEFYLQNSILTRTLHPQEIKSSL